MADIFELDRWLIVARAGHFGACLLLFGVFAFDVFVARSALRGRRQDWNRIVCALIIIAIVGSLICGILWFVRVTIGMSGSSASLNESMAIVWSKTQFGFVCKLRLVFWLGATVAAIWNSWTNWNSKHGAVLDWICLTLAGCLLLSLAWAGHGETGRATTIHLGNDAMHLLAAGLWPTGLLPFLLLLIKLRAAPETVRWQHIADITSRFSLLSLIAVGLLAGTGILNSWCLINSVADLTSTTYGQVLLIKIALFILMVAIGAINLFILKPRLTNLVEQAGGHLEKAAVQLQWQVFAELFLGCVVLIVVAILGLLPPALG